MFGFSDTVRCVIIRVLCGSGYQLHKLEHLFSGIPYGGVWATGWCFFCSLHPPKPAWKPTNCCFTKFISWFSHAFLFQEDMIGFHVLLLVSASMIHRTFPTRYCGLPCNRTVRGGCFAPRQSVSLGHGDYPDYPYARKTLGKPSVMYSISSLLGVSSMFIWGNAVLDNLTCVFAGKLCLKQV